MPYSEEKLLAFKRIKSWCDEESQKLVYNFPSTNTRIPNTGIYMVGSFFGVKYCLSRKGTIWLTQGTTNYILIATYIIAYAVYRTWILELQTTPILQYPPLVTILISLVLQIKMMFMNPGIATVTSKKFNEPLDVHSAVRLYCSECDLVTSRAISHCPFCQCCVEGYDHHCGIIGKCITKPNLKLFNVWTASVGFTFAAFAIALIDVVFGVLLTSFLKSKRKLNTG